MASTVRTDVMRAIEAGIDTNEQIAAATGHALSVVSACTRRLLMDEIITRPKDYRPGPGSKHRYRLNPLYEPGEGGGRQRQEEFKIPPPDPVLAAFFGVRVKCES